CPAVSPDRKEHSQVTLTTRPAPRDACPSPHVRHAGAAMRRGCALFHDVGCRAKGTTTERKNTAGDSACVAAGALLEFCRRRMAPPGGRLRPGPPKAGNPVMDAPPLSRPLPRWRQGWFVAGLLVLFVALSVQYTFKVLDPGRDGRSAFQRWRPQIQQFDEGV